MITLRKANDRGHSDHGWLDSHHSFSFADYHDPEHMGFSVLRVINEDRVAPGAGFATHAHRDMEIISYVLDGALQHQDSMGNGSVIRPGDVQRMSAGTGITHSEYNASKEDTVHFLQIWILPDKPGYPPGYEQKAFPLEERAGCWQLLASGDARDGSVSLHQDVRLYGARLTPGESLTHTFAAGRKAYLHVARGEVTLGSETLGNGDAAAITESGELTLSAVSPAEVLLFDLP